MKSRLLRTVLSLLSPSKKPPQQRGTANGETARFKDGVAPGTRRTTWHDHEEEPGREGDTATIEIDPDRVRSLTITYAPEMDGDPDAGEVIWTWVPYEEADGRGKDRPVLVIGRQDSNRVYAVRLTSKAHDRDRDFLPIGAGPWDSKGRPSWVDIDQLYLVHTRGMRREASALDLDRFTVVARALQKRYGWKVGS